MIYEINKNDFYRCKSLLSEQGQLEVKAVVEGINPGRIFVDNIDSPHSGLVWLGNNDGFIFIGNEENEIFNNAIDHFIHTVIKPDAKKVELNWFEAISNHPKWNKTLEKVFEHRILGSWNQRVYTLQKEKYMAKNEPILKQAYAVLKIRKAVYETIIKQFIILNFYILKLKNIGLHLRNSFKKYQVIALCIINLLLAFAFRVLSLTMYIV